VPPIRICQSIARGVLGREAFAGGAGTAALGVVLHFIIALAMALAYAMVASRVRPRAALAPVRPALRRPALHDHELRRPAAVGGKPSFADHLWVGMSVAFHALFGAIIALGARRAHA
jgi:hypothetical protein